MIYSKFIIKITNIKLQKTTKKKPGKNIWPEHKQYKQKLSFDILVDLGMIKEQNSQIEIGNITFDLSYTDHHVQKSQLEQQLLKAYQNKKKISIQTIHPEHFYLIKETKQRVYDLDYQKYKNYYLENKQFRIKLINRKERKKCNSREIDFIEKCYSDGRQNFEDLNTFDYTIYLKMLTAINFIHLKVLTLQQSKVYSFQFLQFLNTPQLKQLSLFNNDIVQLKMLDKCSFRKIQKLRLNKIDNGINLYSQRFFCPNLEECFINTQKVGYVDTLQIEFQDPVGLRYPVKITKNLPYVLKSQNYKAIQSMYSLTNYNQLLNNNLVKKVKQTNRFIISQLYDIFG